MSDEQQHLQRSEASFTKNKSPSATIFVLKTHGGIHNLRGKKYRRPKNNRSRRFIFTENGLRACGQTNFRETLFIPARSLFFFL